MTLSADEKRDLSGYRMEKAKGLLQDAEILLHNGSPASSANRRSRFVTVAAFPKG